MKKGFAYLPVIIMVALVVLMVPTVKYITSSDVNFDLLKRASEEIVCSSFSEEQCRGSSEDCEWKTGEEKKCSFDSSGKCPSDCEYFAGRPQSCEFMGDVEALCKAKSGCEWKESCQTVTLPCKEKDCSKGKSGCKTKEVVVGGLCMFTGDPNPSYKSRSECDRAGGEWNEYKETQCTGRYSENKCITMCDGSFIVGKSCTGEYRIGKCVEKTKTEEEAEEEEEAERPEDKASCEEKEGLWTGQRCIMPGETDIEGSGRVWCPADLNSPTLWKRTSSHWVQADNCEGESLARSEEEKCKENEGLWTGSRCIMPGETDIEGSGRVWCPADLNSPTLWKRSSPHWVQAESCPTIEEVEDVGGGEGRESIAWCSKLCVEIEECSPSRGALLLDPCEDASSPGEADLGKVCCQLFPSSTQRKIDLEIGVAEECVSGEIKCVDEIKLECVLGEWNEYLESAECKEELEAGKLLTCAEADNYCVDSRGKFGCEAIGGRVESYVGCGVNEACCSFGETKDDEEGDSEWVYYNQNDPQWGDNGFENGCTNSQGIEVPAGGRQGDSSCGQTNFAMLMATYVDPSITPQTVQDEYVPWASTCGTGFSVWRDHLEDNGFTTETRAVSEEKLKEYVTEGEWLAWVSIEGGGISHHTLITGVDSDGNFIFQDPWFGPNTTLSEESYKITGFELIKPPEGDI